jgi:hypothetical protein
MAVATILSPGVSVGGKYEVIEVLGFGGMGVVYKVREQVGAVSRIRALKTVLPQFASDTSVVRRFRQEAEKMCLLEHENIVPVLSYSEEGQFPYLVMPFIEGQTLKEYLADYVAQHGRGLPVSEVMEIGLELVRGLEVAHRFVNPETHRPQPMVHRDIKPGNIMVRVEDDSGERRLKVLIMDFGIAKVLSDQDSGHSLTEVIGTVKYASPEQIRRGKDIDPRADVYSLGMVLYEMYAGRHMFTGLSEHAVLMRMVQRDLKDMEIPFPEGTPPQFREFIERCVAVDRERRFSSVAEMRTVMRRILEEDSERIAKDLAQARDRAFSERARAVEQDAQQFASEALAEGDAWVARGDAAIADQKQTEALPSFRAAAEAFARAAQDSAVGRERDRLAQGLAALADLRTVALAADAERLTPESVAAAAEATRVVERALEAGDLTAGKRALEQAERAWSEAHAAARREQLRIEATMACDRLDAALAETRSDLARIPPHLSDAAGAADIGLAEAEARAARRLLAEADFAGASEAALAGATLLAEAERRRTQRLAQLVDELSNRLHARWVSIGSSPDRDASAEAEQTARVAMDAARRLAGENPNLDAVLALEGAITAVAELEQEIARRTAEREQALLAAERNHNARPGAEEALASLHRARTTVASAGAPLGEEVLALTGAIDEADRAEEAFDRGEYAAALPLLRSAGLRLNDLAGTISRRGERERVLAHLASLRAEATEKSKVLGSLGDRILDAPASRRLLAALASAEERAAQADHSAAIRILEESLPELDRRIAEARTEIEHEHARTEASAVRERAEAALSAVERLGERAIRDGRFASSRDEVHRGRALYEAESFVEAARRFAAGEQALAALGAEIEEAERVERAERLAALAERRAAVVERLAGVPSARPTRRKLKGIRKALAATDRALAAANESEARSRLEEIDARISALLDEAAAAPAVERGIGAPLRAVVIGGGAAAATLLAILVWVTRGKAPPPPTQIAEPARKSSVSEPAVSQPAQPPAAVEAQPTAAPVAEAPPTTIPTAAVSKPEVSTVASVAPTAAPIMEATAPAAVVEPKVAERPAPLVLASIRPRTQTVKVRAGSEPRFEASLKNGDDGSLEWRLDGERVGHGPRVVLGKERTESPGLKRLEVVALREGSPTSLRTWNLEIEAPPLGFASLEPANRSVERPPGARVSFRAPVNLEDGEKLAFLWQVNGQAVRGADGPAYDFQTQSPGEYRVQVSATAPWGASIANTWNLSVRALVPTPDLKKAVDRPDPRAGARAWMQAYCAAFEKKDVDALLTLGHLRSETEAERLRDALASMSDLKVSCTNPSIRTSGDDVVVSFDRTDRWTDPRGTTIERALPRITKHLHLANGRWVATP